MSMASRGKDSEMAATLKKSAQHKGAAVQARKQARLQAFMASLSPGLVGTARYRRYITSRAARADRRAA